MLLFSATAVTTAQRECVCEQDILSQHVLLYKQINFKIQPKSNIKMKPVQKYLNSKQTSYDGVD